MNGLLVNKYGDEDYIVLRSDETHCKYLAEAVNTLAKYGYKPIGGISVRTVSNNGAYLLQAMYREPVETDTVAA